MIDKLERAKEDARFCDDILPRVSRTFALSIQALPDTLKDAVGVSYLLCRVVDTVEDDARIRSERDPLFDAFDLALLIARDSTPGTAIDVDQAAADFERLSAEVSLGPTEFERNLVDRASSVFRVYAGLSHAQRVAIYPHVAEMSDGMREYSKRADAAALAPRREGQKLHGLRLRDLPDLERYCYFVAGTVGGLLTSLFMGTFEGPVPGADTKEKEAALRDRGNSFGLGLQLVNIVKDVANDFERGDCFLPVAVAEANGLDLEDTLDPASRKIGLAVLRALTDRARKHLDRAVEYTLSWPIGVSSSEKDDEGAAIRLFCTVPLALAYATLREVEDGRDALIPGRAPSVSRALVTAVFQESLTAVRDDQALRSLFERCRLGAIGRCPRPKDPVRIEPGPSTGRGPGALSASSDGPFPTNVSAPGNRSAARRDPTARGYLVSPSDKTLETMQQAEKRETKEHNFSGRVFVTGGAGHLGANLVHRLLSDGREVRVLLQEGANNQAIDALEKAHGRKVERFMGDLRDLNGLRKGLEGCESAFHVAAKVSTLSDTHDSLKELFATNVVGTSNILRAARENGTKRVVVSGSFSAVGYDAEDPSKPMDETEPFYPFHQHMPYGRTKMQVEHECLKAVADGQDVVIATSCAILGPWDYLPSRMGRTLIDFTHGKLGAYIPGGFEFVAGKDIAEGHVLAMKRGRTGQKYIISSEFLSVDDIMDIFEEVSGKPRPKLRLPAPLMAGIAEVTSFVLTNFFPKVPQRFTPGAVRILRMQRRAIIDKARNELGYQPSSIRVAIHEAYADFARRGLVPQSPTLSAGGASSTSQVKETRASSEKGVAA